LLFCSLLIADPGFQGGGTLTTENGNMLLGGEIAQTADISAGDAGVIVLAGSRNSTVSWGTNTGVARTHGGFRIYTAAGTSTELAGIENATAGSPDDRNFVASVEASTSVDTVEGTAGTGREDVIATNSVAAITTPGNFARSIDIYGQCSFSPRGEKGEKAYDNLRYLETTCVIPNQHEVIVGLAGDLHHYACFKDIHKRKYRFVSGGGGSSLYPTHGEPDSLQLPRSDSVNGRTEMYKRQKVYPSVKKSRQLSWGCLGIGIWNKYFSVFLGAYYLLTAWILQSNSKNSIASLESYDSEHSVFKTLSFIGKLAGKINLSNIEGLQDSGFELWKILAHSPFSVFMFLILFAGLIVYCDSKNIWVKVGLGSLHAATHIILLVGFMILIAKFDLKFLELEEDQFGQVVLFSFFMLLIGGTFGSIVFGLYLWVCNKFFKIHSKDILLCQRIPDYKHFLRMHIDEKGKLTIYPICISKVPRDWEFRPGASNGQAWFEPQGHDIKSYAGMIHEPIRID